MEETDTLSLSVMLYQFMVFMIGHLFCAAVLYCLMTFLYNTISEWFVCAVWFGSIAPFIHKQSELLTAESSVIISQELL